MNFLAHLYLTQDFPELVSVGNFMADAIKGTRAIKQYPEEIQKGIYIHRAIDDFTDTHDIFRVGTKRLHANYSKYSPVIMDVFYDHILASNWSSYSKTPLDKYCDEKYSLVDRHIHHIPKRTKFLFQYMKRDNWLLSYATEEGIALILERMDKRTSNKSGMTNSINELIEYKTEYEEEFKRFFEEINQFIQSSFY